MEGYVVAGFETLDMINEALWMKDGRPLQHTRIGHIQVEGASNASCGSGWTHTLGFASR